VSTKEQVNAMLVRLTGHHLAKGAPGSDAAQRRLRRELQETRARLAELERAPGKPAGKPAKPKRGVPRDIDAEARRIIQAVRPYTMTGPEKLFALISAVRYVVRYQVPGAFVECGVWRGGSSFAAARTLLSVGDDTRELYLYDTFEGMPPPSEADVRHDGRDAAALLDASSRAAAVWAIASLDDVKAGFDTVPYPKQRVHYVPGTVEQTIPAQAPERIALLRLDTDWYESTDHELRHLYDRLSPGGVLLIDDYGDWAGSRKATDEFLDRTGEPLLLLRMGTGRIAVKPWR
jgi:hypothetical protein